MLNEHRPSLSDLVKLVFLLVAWSGLDGGPAIPRLMDNSMIIPQPAHQKPNRDVTGNAEANGMKHVRIRGSCNDIANGDRTVLPRPETKVASEWLYDGVDKNTGFLKGLHAALMKSRKLDLPLIGALGWREGL